MDHYEIISDTGCGLFSQRVDALYVTVEQYLADEKRQGRQLTFAKVFLSDIANQEEELRRSPLMTSLIGAVPCTIIQQSPIGGVKIALLLKTSDEQEAFSLQSLRLSDDEISNFGSMFRPSCCLTSIWLCLRQRD